MARALRGGVCRNVAFSSTEPKVHDDKIALFEEVVQTSEKEDKRLKRVLADKD